MQCLFCESENLRKAPYPRSTLFNNKKFGYYQCRDCKLIFIDPLPSDEDYSRMYGKTYHDQFYFKEDSPGYEDLYGLIKDNSAEKSLLDYGCGDGHFLQFFSLNGYDCTGVEYDPELIAVLRTRFPDVKFYTVQEFYRLDNETRFGIIHLGDVLEHVGNPNELVNSLRIKLKNEGLIIVEGPIENNFTLALAFRKFVSLFMARKQAYHFPYHISFSNARNQKRIFERNDFGTLYYRIFEASWPMPEKFSLGPTTGLKWLIARISIFFSKIVPGKLGNRFIYVGRKGSEGSD